MKVLAPLLIRTERLTSASHGGGLGLRRKRLLALLGGLAFACPQLVYANPPSSNWWLGATGGESGRIPRTVSAFRLFTDWDVEYIDFWESDSCPFTSTAPVVRHIFDGAPDSQDTCNEACFKGGEPTFSTHDYTCVDALKLSDAATEVSDSDCTTDVGTGSATEFGLLCLCSADEFRRWIPFVHPGDTRHQGCTRSPEAGYMISEFPTNGVDGHYMQAQASGILYSQVSDGAIPYNFAVGRATYFETKLGTVDVGSTDCPTQNEWFVGLASRAMSGSGLTDGHDDYIGFKKADTTDDASNAIYFVAGDTGNMTTGDLCEMTGVCGTGTQFAVATGYTAADDATPGNTVFDCDEDMKLAFLVNGRKEVHVYIDDKEVTGSPFNLTDTAPTIGTQVAISFYMRNADTAAPGDTPGFYFYYFLGATRRYAVGVP